MPETRVGTITHYFGKPGVAIIKATDAGLKVGDTIHIKGHTTDHTQLVESMQVEHAAIQELAKGGEAGILVSAHVHEHDIVHRVT
jgi:putative protease